jgi:tetratricopeptide (TPR) repeat protein
MIQAHDEAQGRLASSSGSKAQNTEGTRAPASATNAAATGETDKADPLAQDEDVPVDLEADDTAERVERSRVAHRLAAAYGSLGDIAKRKKMLELALSFADAELPSMRAELEAVVESARASAARLSAAKHHAAAAMKKYLRNAELALSNLVHPSRGDILEELAEIAKEEGKSSMHSRLAEQVLAQREREAAQQARGAFDKDAQQGDVEGGAGRVVPSGEQVHRMAPASSAGAVRNVGAQSPEPASRADESVLGAMLELGAAQATDGELDKATDTFSKALAMLEATKGREHSALLQVMLPFSAALAAKGDAERALDVALRAKDIVSKLPVDEGLQLTSRVFTLLGAAYAAGDRIDEAIATFRALLKRLEERYAEGTPESVDCLIHLATALARSGDRDGAREVALNALAIDERFLRHDSERLAHTRLRVATVLVRTVGDGKAAEVVLRRLLEGRQQRAPDPELVRVNGMLSAALGAQGKFAEQSVVLEKMLDDLTRLRASPLDVAAILYELGVVYSKMQRIERGLTMIVRSVELLEGSLAYMSRGGGSIAPRMRARIDGALATARFAQGKLYGRLGKNDKMRETFSAVRAELASKLGPQNVHVRLVDAVLDPAGGAWQIDEQLPESLLPDDDVAALRRE